MLLKQNIVRRYTGVYFVLLLAAICVVVQMLYLVLGNSEYPSIDELTIKETSIMASRGRILAHDGRLLATSVYKYRLFNDLRAEGLHDSIFNKNVDALANELNKILPEKTAKEYSSELRRDRFRALKDSKEKTCRYRLLVRQDIDYNILRQLKSLPILKNPANKGGLILEEKIRRVYPHQNMARNTVGRTNYDGFGIVGIESSYNRILAGQMGKEMQQYTTRWMPISSTPKLEPIDGRDIVSTLDIDMQEVAEGFICDALQKNLDVEWGTAVIMDVHTGEVRAIANKRRESRTSGEIVEDENYALNYRKDPGSTFKLASFMVMLEKGLMLTDSVDTGNGKIVRYSKIFEDEGSAGGWLNVQQVFEKSSNVGTIILSERIYKNKINQHDFAERIEALKLKELVQFDIQPNRSIVPNIKSAHKFSGLTLSMMSIGYELEITPLQTLALYNAVANNGILVHPKFIKELRYKGNVEKKFDTEIVHSSICSKSTLDKLHQMLIGVVERGTARRAQSQFFQIAGKTGTAHIADTAGYTNQKLSSFAGYFPADKPRYSCIVAFKTYDTYNKAYGGAIAAPVFKKIAEKVYANSLTWHHPLVSKPPITELPKVKSGHYKDALFVLRGLDIFANAEGVVSDWIDVQSEEGVLRLKNRGLVRKVVPNLCKMGLKDAVFVAENMGLRVQFSGAGTVIKQSIEPGTVVRSGDFIALTLNRQ
ncbi:MAG: penicillin-binding transpeptidase domain-containing protein [Bacteroidales bacterium]